MIDPNGNECERVFFSLLLLSLQKMDPISFTGGEKCIEKRKVLNK